MPKQSQDKPVENLERRIDELVASMGVEAEKLSREIANAAAPDEQFETQGPIAAAPTPAPLPVPAPETPTSSKANPIAPAIIHASLDDQVERMLSDAAPPVAPVMARSQATTTVDAIDGELAELARELLDGDLDNADALLRPDTVDAKPAPPAPAKPAIESFDEDDLLDGDFDDLDDVIAQGETPAQPKAKPTPAPVSYEEATVPAPIPSASIGAPIPAPIAQAKAPVLEPVPSRPEPKGASAPEPEPEPDRSVTHSTPGAPRQSRTKEKAPGRQRLQSITGLARVHAGKAAYTVAERLTKPLDSRPSQLKDITGWLAAVTLFNAVALWIFLLIGRGPAPGVSDEPEVDLVGQPATASVDAEEIE